MAQSILELRLSGLRLKPWPVASTAEAHPQVALAGEAEPVDAALAVRPGAAAARRLAVTLEYCDARFPAYAGRITFGAAEEGGEARLFAEAALAAPEMERLIAACAARGGAHLALHCAMEGAPCEMRGVTPCWPLPAEPFAYGALRGRIVALKLIDRAS